MRVTLAGELGSLDGMLSVACLVPSELGANATWTVQVPPLAATFGLLEQLSWPVTMENWLGLVPAMLACPMFSVWSPALVTVTVSSWICPVVTVPKSWEDSTLTVGGLGARAGQAHRGRFSRVV